MAILYPFRALRPRSADAARIAAVPYDVVSTDEARALADGNPLSFLRVSRAEIELPADTDPHADAVYERAAENFARLKESVAGARGRAEPLLLPAAHGRPPADRARRVLLARRVRPRRHQEARANPARQGRRPHAPHAGAWRADRTGVPHLPGVGGRRRHRDARHGRRAAVRLRRGRRRAAHAVARVRRATATRSSARSRGSPTLYIADGHHRAASAARARGRDRAQASASGHPLGDGADFNTFLAVAFPHDQVQILRLQPDRQGSGGPLARASFSRRLASVSRSTPGTGDAGSAGRDRDVSSSGVADAASARRARIRPIRSGRSTSACCRTSCSRRSWRSPTSAPTSASTSSAALAAPASSSGSSNSGTAAVAFSLFPVSVADLMAVSDAGAIMPPKSHLVRAEAAGRPADPCDLSRQECLVLATTCWPKLDN